MHEEDYGQLLEEYRGLVNSLFSLLLERLYHTNNELFKLKSQIESDRQDREIGDMMNEHK